MYPFSTKLSVVWSQQQDVRGLVRADIVAPAGGQGRLALYVDGDQVWEQTVDLPPDGRVLLHLHSHLLDNGPRRLEWRLSSGMRHWASVPATLEVRNSGPLAARIAAALRREDTPVAFVGDCDAARYRRDDPGLVPWFDQPDAAAWIDARHASGEIDAVTAGRLHSFVRDGYLMMEDCVPDELVTRALADIDRAVADGYQGYRYGDSTRLEQMHVAFPAIREIWLLPAVHRMLALLFGVPAEPCQSLVYVFGSQQDAHQDTIHLTPYPAGYMCGVWAALEDVREGSGELVVYPGSHRLPRVYMHDVQCPKVREGNWTRFGESVVARWQALVEQSGIRPLPYLAKRGSVLIWHENLMHAGSVRRDPTLSRRSVVTHHFAQGTFAYYDSTGLAGHTTRLDG